MLARARAGTARPPPTSLIPARRAGGGAAAANVLDRGREEGVGRFGRVSEEFERETLTHYFTRSFDDLVSKVEGLDEYEARRPLTPSGTNLLGLLQHAGAVVLGYARLPWGRDLGRELMWEDTDDEPDID